MRSAPRALCVAASGLVAGALAAAAPSAPAAAKDIVIRMAVPDWPPTRIMQDLANERYKAPSGNNVKLEADFIPWPVYYERLAASLTSGEKKYQMAVSDSQWLGAFVEGGYYLKINKFIDADPELQGRVQGHAPEPLSTPTRPTRTRRRTTTASHRCRTSWRSTTARICSATRPSSRPTRPSTA
jgi:multiple sugar transport system substrate-binding protein